MKKHQRPWVVLLPLVGLAGALAGCGTSAATPSGRAVRPLPTDVSYTDVARSVGLDFRWKTVRKSPMNILEISSAGAGFLDYDQDGWPDVVLVGPEGTALYRNEGGRRFTDVSRQLGVDGLPGRWHGCAVADVDNDGWPDLLITGYGKQILLRNEGGKRFADVTARTGIASRSWGTSASFFDADADGRLDLLLGSYVKFGPGSPEFMDRNGVKITLGPDAYEAEQLRYFHNRGGLRFEERTREAGFHVSRGRTFGLAACDLDGDGDEDVYAANDEMPGNLFVNDGRGRFTDQGTESGTALSGNGKRQGGMGTAWGDFNNDLRPDLIVTTFTQEPKSLYRNDGRGFFTEVSHSTQLTQNLLPWVGFGVVFADVNLDGLQDVAMVNGHVEDLIHQVDPSNDYPQPMKLFINRGGRFEDISESSGDGFRRSIVGRALAVADYDNDGDPDFLAADLEGQPLLLRCDQVHGGRWIGFDLQGASRSNRMAIGARVTIRSSIGQQTREVRTDGSYLAAHDPRVRFGIMADTKIEEVEVRWPGGQIQKARNLEPNRYYRWKQGAAPRKADLPQPQP